MLQSGVLNSRRKQLVELAIKSRLPAIYYAPEWVEDGGLMSYGVDFRDTARQAAGYAGKILKGANPGDLPVEQPRKFELAVNAKTAKALGLSFPASMARADRIIE